MPSASHDGLPEQEIAPGYSSRFADWGGVTVAFEKAHAGQDASAMVKGLPDDRCQAPHWGICSPARSSSTTATGVRRSRRARRTTSRPVT
jgi:hypothetical protein